jgi:hypothetical protein
MGLNGRTHVCQHFSLDAFGDRLEGFVKRLIGPATVPPIGEAADNGL